MNLLYKTKTVECIVSLIVLAKITYNWNIRQKIYPYTLKKCVHKYLKIGDRKHGKYKTVINNHGKDFGKISNMNK